MTPRKDDSFFQLSLTELAFILVFVVLLLIGAGFVLIGSSAARCETALTQCTAKSEQCEKENKECRIAFEKMGEDPDKVIETLVRAPELAREIAVLKAQNKEQSDKLKAFEELQEKIPDPVRIKKAQDFLDGYEKQKQAGFPPENARKEGEEAAKAARELADCRGQLKFCIKATDPKKKAGFGHPPCWTDAAGNIQYMFGVEIRADGLTVTKAWPPEREEDVRQLPAVQPTINAGLQSLEQFKSNTQSIFDGSKKAEPECRHYVIISRAPSVRDIDYFNRLRLGVEDHFYKLDKTGIPSR